MELSEHKIYIQRVKKAVIIFLCGCLLLALQQVFLSPKFSELKDSLSQTAVLAKQITAVQQETANYETLLTDSGKTYANLVTEKDGYISALGILTQENQLNINKMTVDDIKETGKQLYSMKVVIELQGDLYNVKNLIQQLYDSPTVSRINSFSYRQQGKRDLQWMWRDIDDTQLVPWWDLSGVDGKEETPKDEPPPLCADDLMSQGTALCFLEVEFLGTGG